MKGWRNSASLILAARHGHGCSRTVSSVIYNYKLLCLKRHQNSNFMPGTYVFPGGAMDPADSDLRWHELFTSYGFDKNSFASLVPKITERPLIFRSQENELSREISLRITAIRETFEESGVLICKRKNNGYGPANWAQCASIPENELRIWQKKVHNDGTEFYTLCKKFECYPDLWALYEWSNWMTPTHLNGRRFNNAFFFACVPFSPDTEYPPDEIEDLRWETAGCFISPTMDIKLPPPQQYEITRIAEFEDIDKLLESAVERSKIGVQLYLPVLVHLRDGVIHVLPGDSMYPKEVSLSEKQIIDKSDITIEEFHQMSPVKNRMEWHSFKANIICENNTAESIRPKL